MQAEQRPLRADAVRNRAKIFEAARSEIAEHGPDVGMEAIAIAAGVAVGTLYRHFPTKTDLVAAVLSAYTEQITVEAELALARARSGSSPLRETVSFLREVIRVSAINEATKAAAPALGATHHADETRAASALGELLALGVTAGEIRPDLTVSDVYILIAAAPLDQSAVVRERWTRLMLPCLTAAAAEIDLPGMAITS